jgi:spore coat polysaccharide biosynthesis protein SpsF
LIPPACPEDSVAAFEPLAVEAGFEIFAGPKEDVLKRYCLAIDRFKPEQVIRATADNPFVFADAAAEISSQAFSLGVDYAGYAGLPPGAGVEAVSAQALLRADTEAKALPEREHVCPYLYGNPQMFRLHRCLAPRKWQGDDIRITVDTQEDYRRAQLLYDALDRLEKSGELFEGERYKGKTIIDTYLKVFRQADARKSDAWEPA